MQQSASPPVHRRLLEVQVVPGGYERVSVFRPITPIGESRSQQDDASTEHDPSPQSGSINEAIATSSAPRPGSAVVAGIRRPTCRRSFSLMVLDRRQSPAATRTGDEPGIVGSSAPRSPSSPSSCCDEEATQGQRPDEARLRAALMDHVLAMQEVADAASGCSPRTHDSRGTHD